MHDKNMEEWRHFILYAKGHYRKTALLEDLKQILAKYCRIEPGQARLFDICEILLGIYLSHSTEARQKDLVMRIFSSEECGIITAIEHLIGAISTIKVFQGEKELLALGEPDPDILELSSTPPQATH